MDKQQLRKRMKEERKKLNIEDLSVNFVQKLKKMKEYENAKNIMFFYPLVNEINLLALLEDKTKKFYLPKIVGKDLVCCPYSQGDALSESSFKTKEPLTEPIEKQLIELVIVPALAVDKNNHRLGYGGGFYDRFLLDLNAYKVVCLPSNLVLESVYPEKHDVKIDKILVI